MTDNPVPAVGDELVERAIKALNLAEKMTGRHDDADAAHISLTPHGWEYIFSAFDAARAAFAIPQDRGGIPVENGVQVDSPAKSPQGESTLQPRRQTEGDTSAATRIQQLEAENTRLCDKVGRMREALVACAHQLDVVRPRDGYQRAYLCTCALKQADEALADQPK